MYPDLTSTYCASEIFTSLEEMESFQPNFDSLANLQQHQMSILLPNVRMIS